MAKKEQFQRTAFWTWSHNILTLSIWFLSNSAPWCYKKPSHNLFYKPLGPIKAHQQYHCWEISPSGMQCGISDPWDYNNNSSWKRRKLSQKFNKQCMSVLILILAKLPWPCSSSTLGQLDEGQMRTLPPLWLFSGSKITPNKMVQNGTQVLVA